MGADVLPMPTESVRPPATADAQAFWSQPRGRDVWAKYWAAGQQAHRQVLLQRLHALPVFHSALEVGCAAGTNLALIREAFPWVRLAGSDVNLEALHFAAEHLTGVEWRHATVLDMLRAQPARSQDVVVTCYTLAYHDVADVMAILTEMLRVARIGCLFAEPLAQGGTTIFQTPLFPEWAHDYGALLQEALTGSGRTAALSAVRLVVPVDRCNGIVTCVFTS